jgi:hypothetical protein
MKCPIYLRVAKAESRKGYKVTASTEPSNEPISTKDYRGYQFYPTVAFCVNIEVPDELFDQSERVIAELNVGMKEAQITSEIALPKGISLKQTKETTQK